jgi:hypothetical protein
MIYVHDNPGNINFNSVVYVFLRYWYTPDLTNHKFTSDSWFAVPAVKVETHNSVKYTLINNKLDFSAMMIVTDNGRLIRANRISIDNKVPSHQVRTIKQEAFSIPNWEHANQKSFPYDTMFDGARVSTRYQERNGTNKNAYFSTDSNNKLFTDIKRSVSPKPCNCGKATYIG